MTSAKVYMHNDLAGSLVENEEGYTFRYNQDYLTNPASKAVSLTLGLSDVPYKSRAMFPFSDGIIPEGWLIFIQECSLNINHYNNPRI